MSDKSEYEQAIAEGLAYAKVANENRIMRELLERFLKADDFAMAHHPSNVRVSFAVGCDEVVDDTRDFLDSTK